MYSTVYTKYDLNVAKEKNQQESLKYTVYLFTLTMGKLN